MGHEQTFQRHKPISALPPKADIGSDVPHVRFVPTSDIARSFDDLVGEREHFVGDRQAERLCGLEIDREVKLDWLLDRNIASICAVEDFVNVVSGAPEHGWKIWSVGEQCPDLHGGADIKHHR
jgi:hypothetical protein